jgi:hypothetical protein
VGSLCAQVAEGDVAAVALVALGRAGGGWGGWGVRVRHCRGPGARIDTASGRHVDVAASRRELGTRWRCNRVAQPREHAGCWGGILRACKDVDESESVRVGARAG